MKRPKRGTLLMAVFLLLWSAAMIGLVIIGFTHIQPAGIGGRQSAYPAPTVTTPPQEHAHERQ